MLRTTFALALAMPLSFAFQEDDAPFLGDQDQFQSTQPENLALIDAVGTTPCIFKLGDSFYDYTPFKLAYPDPEVPYYTGTPIPLTPTPQYQFVFGWCQQLSDVSDQTLCKQDFYAGRLDASPEPTPESPCTAYSGGDALSDISTSEISGKPLTKDRIQSQATNTLNGVKLTYGNGSICPETQEKTSFSLNMYCDPDMGLEEYDFSLGVLGNLCDPYVDVVAGAACPRLSVSELWGYLADYSDYFGAGLLLVGTLLVFIGRMLLKPAVCFAGCMSTLVVTCIIYYSVYLNDVSDLSEFWYFLGGGAVAGIIVGLLLAWCVRIGAAVLAGWGGLVGALILNESILFRAEQPWLFWVSVVACTAGAAILAFFILDEVVIISTAMLGSYCLVRGVACYAGHYYNEVTMAKMAKDGLLQDIDPWYWAYVAGFFIMIAVGMFVQCKHYKKEKAKLEAAKHPYLAAKQVDTKA